MCNLVMVIGPHQSGCCCHCFDKGEPSATQSAVLQPFQLYSGAYNFGGLAESHLIHPPSLNGGEGSLPGFVPSNDMVDSEFVVGIKLGDCGMVIGYQVVMCLLASGLQSGLLLLPTFILGSLVRCYNH